MPKLLNIIEAIESVISPQMIEEGDNSGLLVGDRMQEISHIRMALEATVDVIDSAVEDGVDLLVVHHPMIFRPVGQVTSDSLEGRKILKLIRNGVALFAAHSNFDRIEEGLNRTFGGILGLHDVVEADVHSDGYVLKGLLDEPLTLRALTDRVKDVFKLETVRYVGKDEDVIRSVGFCTGSGMSFINDHLFEEVDVYLTGDLKYHDAMWVYESGYNVVDMTHFGSEIIAAEVFYRLLENVVGTEVTLTMDRAIRNPIKQG